MAEGGEIPESEWTNLGYVDMDTVLFGRPSTLNLELKGLSDETLSLLTGGAFPTLESAAEVSVMIDTTDTVSGRPEMRTVTTPKPSWWRWRARKAWDDEVFESYAIYLDEHDAWVEAGRPDKEILIRRYIPRATVTREPALAHLHETKPWEAASPCYGIQCAPEASDGS